MFFLWYMVNTVVVAVVARIISQTKWTLANKVHIVVFSGLLVFVGLISAWISVPWIKFLLSLSLLGILSLYCLYRLLSKTELTIRGLAEKVKLKKPGRM